MLVETKIRTDELAAKTNQCDPDTELERVSDSLKSVLARIRVDRTRAPEGYLKECEVPHGGE